MLGTNLGAAFRDVAIADSRFPANELHAIVGVERVHLQSGESNEQAWTCKGRLVFIMITNHVANVLAKKTLDTLVKLLHAVDVFLKHATGAVGLFRFRFKRGHLTSFSEIERDVGHEVANHRKCAHGRNCDGLAGLEDIHARHTHEPRFAVDLGTARSTFAGFAVPANR